MTNSQPPKLKKPTSPTTPDAPSNNDNGIKPYAMVSFPSAPPPKAKPAGHHKYLDKHIHGTLFLTLKVQTPLHVSTGVVALGTDVNARVPLIKTMTMDTNKKLVIQGSSLKGCIRAIYEAITNSTLAVNTLRAYREKLPNSDKISPCNNKNNLCSASQVFGALDWQGLVEFSDAVCDKNLTTTGFMPSLYAPKPEPFNEDTNRKELNRNYFNSHGQLIGRKFYYNFAEAVSKGESQGIPVQQASKDFAFRTEIHFKNLKPEQLGTLLIILGQDSQYPIALKIGGGKPIGMGTMTVAVDKIEQAGNLRDRYSSYEAPEADQLTGNKLQEFMQQQISIAKSSIIQKDQLTKLAAILAYPSTKQPPSGMY